MAGLIPAWVKDLLPDLGFLDPWTRPGPVADVWALASVTVMIVASVAVVRGGRWPWRVALVLAAASWPLPDHPAQGPVLFDLSYQHGVHAADLLSVAAVAIAVAPWGRLRRLDRSGSDPVEPRGRRRHGR